MYDTQPNVLFLNSHSTLTMTYFGDQDHMRNVIETLRPKLLRGLPPIEMAQEFPGLSSNTRVRFITII